MKLKTANYILNVLTENQKQIDCEYQKEKEKYDELENCEYDKYFEFMKKKAQKEEAEEAIIVFKSLIEDCELTFVKNI